MDRDRTTRLLMDARDGSPAAMNALLERCADKLHALIRLRMGRDLRRRVESRDVLNDVLLKAFQRIDQFDRADGDALMGWLARIAENELRDQRAFHGRERRDAGREVVDEAVWARQAAEVRTATQRLAARERLRRVEAALETLPEDQREAILLRRFEEQSFPEMSRRMGRSTDACRMLYARAMAALTLALRDAS